MKTLNRATKIKLAIFAIMGAVTLVAMPGAHAASVYEDCMNGGGPVAQCNDIKQHEERVDVKPEPMPLHAYLCAPAVGMSVAGEAGVGAIIGGVVAAIVSAPVLVPMFVVGSIVGLVSASFVGCQ